MQRSPKHVQKASNLDLLNVEHQIAAGDELHHKVEAVAALERGVEARQVGAAIGEREDAPLRHGAVHVVFLDHGLLLDHLRRRGEGVSDSAWVSVTITCATVHVGLISN